MRGFSGERKWIKVRDWACVVMRGRFGPGDGKGKMALSWSVVVFQIGFGVEKIDLLSNECQRMTRLMKSEEEAAKHAYRAARLKAISVG